MGRKLTEDRVTDMLILHFETISSAERKSHKKSGSMYVSGKLPTYPSPNLTFCPKREVLMLGLGRGRWAVSLSLRDSVKTY